MAVVEHDSKPLRERQLFLDGVGGKAVSRIRTFDEAVACGPNQAFTGNVHPRDLPSRPWTAGLGTGLSRWAPVGEIMPEDEFVGLLAACDVLSAHD